MRSASGSCTRPSARSLDGLTAATSAATTASSATYVLVAGTASSRPAWQRSCQSAAAANGERARSRSRRSGRPPPARRAPRPRCPGSGPTARWPAPGHRARRRRLVDRGDRWLHEAGRQAEVGLEQVLRVDRGVIGGATAGDHDPARPRCPRWQPRRRAAPRSALARMPSTAARDLADLAPHRESVAPLRSPAAANAAGSCRFISSSASSSGPRRRCARRPGVRLERGRTSARAPRQCRPDGEALEGLHGTTSSRMAAGPSVRCGSGCAPSRSIRDGTSTTSSSPSSATAPSVADVDHLDVAGAVMERGEQLRGGLAVEGAATIVEECRLGVERRIGVHLEQAPL